MANLTPFNGRNRGPTRGSYDDFYTMLDEFFNDTWIGRQRNTFKVDVQETENEYLIEAELPGVKKDEINLDLSDGNLNISIQREEDVNQDDKNYIHRERRYCSMSRSIYLADANPEGIRAKLDHGLLKISVQRHPNKEHNKRIEIE